jgi:hypothetical protein
MENLQENNNIIKKDPINNNEKTSCNTTEIYDDKLNNYKYGV